MQRARRRSPERTKRRFKFVSVVARAQSSDARRRISLRHAGEHSQSAIEVSDLLSRVNDESAEGRTLTPPLFVARVPRLIGDNNETYQLMQRDVARRLGYQVNSTLCALKVGRRRHRRHRRRRQELRKHDYFRGINFKVVFLREPTPTRARDSLLTQLLRLAQALLARQGTELLRLRRR